MSNKSWAIHGDKNPSYIAKVAMATNYIATKFDTVRNQVDIATANTDNFAWILQREQATAWEYCVVKNEWFSLAKASWSRAIWDPLTPTTAGALIKSTTNSDKIVAVALQVVATWEIGEVYILPTPIRRNQFSADLVEVIDPTTPASTGKAKLYTMTPTWSVNVPMASVQPAWSNMFIKVLTSWTNSYTLTFTTNMLTTWTLATGTASGKVFVMQFVSDGTNWIEVSRTTAI